MSPERVTRPPAAPCYAMRMRRFPAGGPLFGALLLVACGSGGASSNEEATPRGATRSQESNGDAPSPTGGSCSGYAIECYKIDTISSCFRQRGCYRVTDDCSGKQVFCNLLSEQQRCVEQLGCFWQTPSGEKIAAPTGSCTGSAVPCDTFADEATCDEQPGPCNWNTSKSRCERDYAVYGECAAWNQDVMFPDEAKAGCERRKGCSWVTATP